MLRGPKLPSGTKGAHEYARQERNFNTQRGAAPGAGGMITTKGFIPSRKKQQVTQRGTEGRPVWLS
jgi:hypothetical protein